MMSEPGSFAALTLAQRWPAVVQRIMSEHSFPSEIVNALESLVAELKSGTIRSLSDSAPDASAWESDLQPYLDRPWLDVPWFFAEVYFYRRILEATQFFGSGEWQGVDPFAIQKQTSLSTVMSDVRAIASQSSSETDIANDPTGCIEPIKIDPNKQWQQVLWGNRADLSLRPTADADSVHQSTQSQLEQSHILVDDTLALMAYLSPSKPGSRIDWIADNAGFELISDLGAIDWLIGQGLAETIYLHLKAHPTFVSDATVADVEHTLATLIADSDYSTQRWGQRLQSYLEQGQLQLTADWVWTSPLCFWEMPALQQNFCDSALVVVKGDANYRRLLGDRHWPFTTPFADIVAYFPAPLVACRTLKSELVAGLSPAQIATLTQQDPEWLTNGHWGLIQFVP